MGGVAVGGSTEGRLFRAAAFVIGADRIDAPLIGYTVDSGGFENRNDAGTVGAAVLSRYRLILDYPRNRIILEDGPNAGDDPTEDHSGILVVSPGPAFDSLVIAQVIPGSPAAEAGLAPGDEITSMDGRSGWTLRDVRLALEQPGPIDLVVRKDGELREVILQRRPLLPLG
jgi:membrane-associated protease RseP (regulator of RpoE activity)